MNDDDEALQPPCVDCDEPVAVDEDGFSYDRCSAHLLAVSEPFERQRQDPDQAMQALRDRRAS